MLTCTQRQGELAVGLALLGLAGYVTSSGLAMPAGTLALPGPGFQPILIGLALGLASLALLIQAWPRPRAEVEPLRLGGAHIALGLAGLAWVSLTLEALGSFLSLGAFLLVLFKVYSGRSWWRSAVAAALAVLAAWAFFGYLLGVQLPRGVL